VTAATHRRLREAACGAALLLGTAAAAAAQAASLTQRPAVRAVLATLERDNAWTLEQQASLCEIPAPPFGESARGAELERRLRGLGYRDIAIDEVGNVVATRRGAGRGAALILSAHLDTVFPEGTDVTVRREGARMSGPGIVDDCRGLAVLLAVARALEQSGIRTRGDLLLVGTVGEEGPGNLRGVRHLFAASQRRAAGFISIDGTGLSLTTRAVGSHRYTVTFSGPGGHSYGDFGMPNPIHAMGRAIAAIADLSVPADPRTVFNVGVVEGGVSVNSIAATASMQVDLRSVSPAALARVDSGFRAAMAGAAQAERARWPASRASLEVAIDDIGRRPAAEQSDTLPIIRAAQEAARALGVPVPQGQASSTDANLPMSLGIPAITIGGGGRGDGAHSLGEWYEDGDRGYLGPQWAVLIALAMVGVVD
jgi:acetylornithine deacetylase/succinyl-diaminopimelate desuccinylase-like protein